MGQLVRQSAIQAEGLQVQPDEAEAVLIKQHKQPRGSLGTGETMPGNQARPVEAGMDESIYQTGNISFIACEFEG